MTALNLTALRELRAKMTPGEWEAVDEFVYDEHSAVMQALQRDADAAGIVTTHNAADTLIEIAEAALAWKATLGRPRGDRNADDAEAELLAALAKVSP